MYLRPQKSTYYYNGLSTCVTLDLSRFRKKDFTRDDIYVVVLAFKFTHGVKDAGGTLDDSKLRPQADKRTTAASPVFALVVASD